jgi:crotonobetainyl-CoA:carnitine CoA-transferase CaiB-like acyl-CoA transferase
MARIGSAAAIVGMGRALAHRDDPDGLDYGAVRAVRPDVIYCSISGYGQTGPMAQRPAGDLMVQAVGGLMAQTGELDGRPMKAAAPVADAMGGLSAVIAIITGALMERQRTGEVRYLDISMLDGLTALMGQSIAAWGMTGRAPRRWGNGHPLMAPYESFRCADREIVIAVTNEKTWRSLVALPGFMPLATDPRYADQPSRDSNHATLMPAIEAVLRTRPAIDWLAAFDAAGIPAEPINSLEEVVARSQLGERGMLVEVEYPPGSGNRIRTAGMPWRAVASQGAVRSPPALGQHTAEILGEMEEG